MLPNVLKIATRESPLAMWQAEHVRKALLTHWPKLTIELVPMKTTGDKFLKDNLITIGGKGLFVKELEDALLKHRADLAVHSMKDVPAEFPKGLILGAICKRHNPFDALLSTHYNGLQELPLGAVVGTVSLRRQTQLLALRQDLQMKMLRGNILTRIKKLEAGEYDAIVLAVSGLERLHEEQYIKETFSAKTMLPACGQGALGIECREQDESIRELIAPLNDDLTERCVKAERTVNALLGGNCRSPLAVYCEPNPGDTIHLMARLLDLDGQSGIAASLTGTLNESQALAVRLAEELNNQGAAKLIHNALRT
ncbi:hydroxymethylbilane synthase [Legionella impletisoli]|uniref:Porphobilinogen deaminase n=1 Tax=Legionella impletisoli TaxID=343510 RepID=A0A917JWZ3_9GAMM|nr:hydroxymethylbilane synthase [Legionella impletisoli]GGI89204.1 porphobilinogen deaminase [Legionella impletisoli]